jgi:DNA-binding CsgD family transcriptional regulator/PAS domain-containing protein
LSALYDAAADPALWECFLRRLAQTTQARSAALVMHDFRQDSHALSRSWQIDPEELRLYQEYYGTVDIWTQRGQAKPAGHVCTSQSLCPLAEMRTTEVYNDFMVPYDVEHGMFCLAENTGSRMTTLSLYRTSSSPEFGNSDLDILHFLTPHLQRVFRLHFQFSELKTRAAGFEKALDMLPTAVIFLGAQGEIVFMNLAARQLTSAKDGLVITRKGLRAGRSSESTQLETLVAEAVSTSAGKGSGPAGGLLVSRKNGLPLQVLIAPVRNLVFDGVAPVCAVAFVSDPSQRVRPVQEILRSLFGLTPAECRVALLLADGRPPREIGQTLGVSAYTLKTHLSSIYGKTSTSGQLQLLRLLSQLSINVAQEDRALA